MLHLSLLGALNIQHSSDAVVQNTTQVTLTPKARALLVYLVATATAQTCAALASLLWGDAPPAERLRQLNQTLDELQQHLPDHVAITAESAAWRADAPHEIDIHAFAQKTAALSNDASWIDAADLQAAAQLYRGEFWADLPTAELTDAPAFLAWVQEQRGRWRRQMVRVLRMLIAEYVAQRDHAAVIETAQRLLKLDPADEAAHRGIMLAQARRGRFDYALAQYEACARALIEHENREPDAETEDLYARIEQARVDATTALPTEASPFVGREAEMAQLHNMLLNPECRLITLTGLGGIGKTRLALETVRRVNEETDRVFLNGVVFVPLAGMQTEEAMPLALTSALGLVLAGNVDATTQILSHLRNRELLLVLDNVEHLVADGRNLVVEILRECPHVTVLVTSRVPLRLEPEWRFDVTGLTCAPPAPDAPEPCASSRLFAQAARRIDPSFRLDDSNRMDVYRLGEVVSGIPLALELAAAWTRTLSCAEILAKIETSLDTLTDQQQRFTSRQRSMRVIFDYTWTLLTGAERELLQALSVFHGPFSEETVAQITQQDTVLLTELVERHLLQVSFAADGMRYAMHELIRQYAAEKLAATPGAAAVHGNHCRCYLAWAAEQEATLFGSAPHEAVAALRQEIDNLRAAWQWAVAHLADPDIQQALAAAIEAHATFYEYVGWVQEGERLMAVGVAACDALAGPASETLQDILCQLLVKQARFAELQNDNPQVEMLTSRAVELARSAGNRLRYADALRVWGRALGEMGEFAESIHLLEQAVKLYRELGRSRDLANTLNALGGMYLFDQNTGSALQCTEEALQRHTALGNQRGAAFSISQIGNAYYFREEFPRALSHLQQALAQFEEVQYPLGVARTANNVGYVHWRMGNHDEALPYLERSLQLAQRMGIRREEGNVHESLGSVYLALGAYTRARRSFERALALAESGDWKLGIGWTHNSLGLLYLELEEYGQAREHFQKALEQMQILENEREIAACLGRLGIICQRTGHAEEAHAHYGSAIQMLLDTGGKHEAAEFMVEKARLLLEQGKLADAESTVRAAIELAQAAEHRTALHEGRLLLARITAAGGDLARARQQLHAQLVEAESTAERAAIHYTLWRTDGDLQYAQRAHTFYTELYARTPLHIYGKRLAELPVESAPQLGTNSGP